MQDGHEPEAACELRLFGPMAVRVRGGPIPRLRSRKGMWLLALLILRDGVDVDRDWLAGVLWPDHDEASAKRSLRQSLHDLRLCLDSEAWRLDSHQPRRLRFETRGADIDLLRFNEAIAGQDLEAAIAIYRGPLLEGCSADWIDDARRRAEQTYLSALLGLADQATHEGQFHRAAARIRQAISVEPYREDLRVRLMRVLHEVGDDAAAVECFLEFQTFLWKEMSIVPGREVTDLHDRIRAEIRARGTPAAQPRLVRERIPKPLPAPLTRFIGREREADRARSLLRESRLVTLTGPGGMGKTRLAIQVASECFSAFEQGCVWVDLSEIRDPAMIIDAVFDVTGVKPGPGIDPALDLAAKLQSSQMLLVMDNCEHLVAACADLFASLLERCPRLAILATSRQVLGVRGETVCPVPALGLPPAGSTNPGSHASVALFVERARAAQPAFELTHANAPSVAEICRNLDGIPLAIELAAARVGGTCVKEIARRLGHGTDFLAGAGTEGDRHRTLDAAMRWSWDLLSDGERRILARLSIFAGTWDLAAARAVCPDESEATVADAIAALTDKSLVILTSLDEPRYHLLETVRRFAAERLVELGDFDITVVRHIETFLARATDIQPKLLQKDQSIWFRALEQDLDNFRAAIVQLRERGDIERELRLCVALSRFLDTHGHLREGRQLLESLIARMDARIPPADQAMVHGIAAWAAIAQFDPAAIDHLHHAIEICRETGDLPGVALSLNLLGCAYTNQGEFTRAEGFLRQSVEICQEVGLHGLHTAVLNNLGDALMRRGDLPAARDYLNESVRLQQEIGSVQLPGVTACALALLEIREGDYVEAEAQCVRAIRCFMDCGAAVGIPGTLELFAVVAAKNRRWKRFAQLLGAAAPAMEEIGLSTEPAIATDRAESEQAAIAALGFDVYEAEFKAGTALTLDEAVAMALDAVPEESRTTLT